MSTRRRSARSRQAPRVFDWIARAATHSQSSRSSPTRSTTRCSGSQRSNSGSQRSSSCSFSEAVAAAANDRITDSATVTIGDIATARVPDSVTVAVGDNATDSFNGSVTVEFDDRVAAKGDNCDTAKTVHRIYDNSNDFGFAHGEAMPAPIQCDSPPRRDAAEALWPGIMADVEPSVVGSERTNGAEWPRKAADGIAMLLEPSSAAVVVEHNSNVRVQKRGGRGDSDQGILGSSVCAPQLQRLQQKQVDSTRRSVDNDIVEFSFASEHKLDLNRMCSYVLPRHDLEEKLQSHSGVGDSVHEEVRDVAEQRFLLAQEMRRISLKRIDRENDVAAANEARRMLSVQSIFQNMPSLGSCPPRHHFAVTTEKNAEEHECTVSQNEVNHVRKPSANTDVVDTEGEIGESIDTNVENVDENTSHHEEGQQRQKRAFVRKMQVLGRRRLERIRQAGTNSPAKVPKENSRRSNRVLIKNALQFVCLAGGATDLERISCMDELQRSKSEWFIVLLRKNMLKFKALYSVEDGVIQKIFGDGPAQIDSSMVDSVYKYNSAAKCFEMVHARGITAITDAVALKPSLRRRVRVSQLN